MLQETSYKLISKKYYTNTITSAVPGTIARFLSVLATETGRFVGEHLAASFLSQCMPKAFKLLYCIIRDTFGLRGGKSTVSLGNEPQSNRRWGVCVELACILNECILANAMHVCTQTYFYLPNTVLMLYIK